MNDPNPQIDQILAALAATTEQLCLIRFGGRFSYAA